MDEISNQIAAQRNYFQAGNTKSYDFRKQQLETLKQTLQSYENELIRALKTDLNKSEYEAYASEIGILYKEINDHLKQLKDWMDPIKVKTPLTHKGSKNYIVKEPYGTVLVIAPWNYPINLALAPVIGAISAGNTIVLKPSEWTPHVSAILRKMVAEAFPPDYFVVIEGDKEVSEALLDQRFDYIFFTGSVPVGRIVMEKASRHLTPVTLELGGKSPAIVDNDAKIDLAAKRIVWGKFVNAGQTCIAPDYLFVHEDVKQKLLKKMQKHIISMFGKDPLANKDYTHIVSARHFDRLENFLDNGKVVHGGTTDRVQRIIAPTLLDEIDWNDPVMQEEIFGPILPILTFRTLDEAVEQVKMQEKPLALYYFGEKEKKQQQIIDELSFGGGCINDTLYHILNPHLPFGGVGNSGMGAYHGESSFDTFSHRKSITEQTTKFDYGFRYPGSKLGLKFVRKLFK
ncbi:aldehyde dehydrogenase [Thalassobacillus hwangdonensis]|uniref:Aldehyde dehydrogenase n=1 Tax=Thalassobacillus hwangdonensis TaxID=546108 RepID=A0ABW3KZE2_9BACI